MDTEFTDPDEAELLSVALVAEDGRECYVELLDDVLEAHSSEFVRAEVLPQLGKVPGARANSYADLGERVAGFLASLGPAFDICYDLPLDKELLLHALMRTQEWSRLAKGVRWRNVVIETEPEANDTDGAAEKRHEAVEASYANSLNDGLRRHHAVADARALKDAYAAVNRSAVLDRKH